MQVLTPQQIARAATAYADKAEPRFSATDDHFDQAVRESLSGPARTVTLDAAGTITLETPYDQGRPPPRPMLPERLVDTGTGTVAAGHALSIWA